MKHSFNSGVENPILAVWSLKLHEVILTTRVQKVEKHTFPIGVFICICFYFLLLVECKHLLPFSFGPRKITPFGLSDVCLSSLAIAVYFILFHFVENCLVWAWMFCPVWKAWVFCRLGVECQLDWHYSDPFTLQEVTWYNVNIINTAQGAPSITVLLCWRLKWISFFLHSAHEDIFSLIDICFPSVLYICIWKEIHCNVVFVML